MKILRTLIMFIPNTIRKPLVAAGIGIVCLVETLSSAGVVHPTLTAIREAAQTIVSVVGGDSTPINVR